MHSFLVAKINEAYIKGVKFHFINRMSEVLDLALVTKKIQHPIDIELLAELK